jgi:hypothetical protein
MKQSILLCFHFLCDDYRQYPECHHIATNPQPFISIRAVKFSTSGTSKGQENSKSGRLGESAAFALFLI